MRLLKLAEVVATCH